MRLETRRPITVCQVAVDADHLFTVDPHTRAALEPMPGANARISRGQLTVVTSQISTSDVAFQRVGEVVESRPCRCLVSTAARLSSASPTSPLAVARKT